MDESTYERLARDAFHRVLDLFEPIDAEDAEVEPSGDVIRIDLRGGQRIVMNTQRPARQIWLAGGQQAWHFSYDAERASWLDDKGRGELFETLRAIVQNAGGPALAP
jgi:CyaY protein